MSQFILTVPATSPIEVVGGGNQVSLYVLTYGAQGPTGAAGADGAVGPPGPTGAAGADGAAVDVENAVLAHFVNPGESTGIIDETSNVLAAIEVLYGYSQYLFNNAVPPPPGQSSKYFRGDGAYVTLNTGAVPELGLLYFTAARARAALAARISFTFSSATPAINTDTTDVFKLTAQAVAITSFTANLTGTPTDFQLLIVLITATSTQTIAWGSKFEASTVALPTTTVGTNPLEVHFRYNITTAKWRCIMVV